MQNTGRLNEKFKYMGELMQTNGLGIEAGGTKLELAYKAGTIIYKAQIKYKNTIKTRGPVSLGVYLFILNKKEES